MAEQKPKAPEPPKNPSPKQRFLLNTRLVKDYVGILDNDAFHQTIDFALLEYQSAVSRQAVDAITASAAGFKMQGALEFLQILKSLPDTAVSPRRKDLDNLHELT